MGSAVDALSKKHALFARAYVASETFNGTQAAIEAGFSKRSATSQASKLLARDDVQAAISELLSERNARLDLQADDVVQQLWNIATADYSKMSKIKRGSCRHCHGKDFAYQWRTEEEFTRAHLEWQIRRNGMNEGDDFKLQLQLVDLDEPSPSGGYGYRFTRDPHPDCPYCDGIGDVHAHFEATDDLPANIRATMTGVKQSQHGIEIKTKDPMRALELVGKHLGMFSNVEITPSDDLADLLAGVQGAALGAVTDE
ncbi:terminase small subunit [Celeribacter sp.]|uniref:terminase small subunit n=1 Tax=Celeribacter sp. TaxID=1890673 RepID=UPI003A8E7705